MSQYVIVTETGGDVPRDYASQHGVALVPMHVQFGGESRDDGTFPTEEVFRHYERTGELPQTSGCTPQDFVTVFDRIHERNPQAHIIYLAYSAVTTCSFESARLAAEGRDYVSAFDTRSVTAAQFLIVSSVVRFVEEKPEATLEEVEALVNDLVQRSRMSFIPGGLEFLHAGGRLSNGAYLGAQLLRIKPVIEIIEGKLVATKKLRGSMDKCVARMVEDFITREEMDTTRIAFIRNEGLSEEIQRAAEQAVTQAGFEEFVWIETGGVIASHCGPGSFGIAGFAK